ncbi:MAG: 2,3-bisphosphoglycerate-independent phosphoglycerate mutase [Legionellaceae bacterium]|nr:2,3-bisphosphoglycerate-independent phosphoglycerate mutase [Legionellaceae bacterium]
MIGYFKIELYVLFTYLMEFNTLILNQITRKLGHNLGRSIGIVPFRKPPLLLLILDGWGHGEAHPHNAITQAQTPVWDELWKSHSRTLLNASGTAVGLPIKQVGNSEVGHMHIGSGRRVPQDLTRLEESIHSGEFQKIAVLNDTVQKLKKTGKTLHVMGLFSPGGVHSHENHLFTFLDFCKEKGFHQIALHLFLDGRDTPPRSALQSIERLEKQLVAMPGSVIASITGRYYALDRDNNWDRIKRVYQLLAEGQREAHFETASIAINAYYQENITDEYIPPTQISQAQLIEDEDAVFFFNFRSDRARQLTESFISKQFSGFNRQKKPCLADFISMTQYATYLETTPVFPPVQSQNTLGACISSAGMRQLRIAETEKYAHVTFFLNGGLEKPFLHEERILIPSPKVATYDLQPEMSVEKITERLVVEMIKQKYDLIICNLANADMVGHTGNLDATIRAIEAIDACLQRILYALKFTNGSAIITADHGNAEKMFDDETGQPHTAHTSEPVPCLYIGDSKRTFMAADTRGSLIDIAPTILELLELPKPKEMSGQSLLRTRYNFFEEARTKVDDTDATFHASFSYHGIRKE